MFPKSQKLKETPLRNFRASVTALALRSPSLGALPNVMMELADGRLARMLRCEVI